MALFVGDLFGEYQAKGQEGHQFRTLVPLRGFPHLRHQKTEVGQGFEGTQGNGFLKVKIHIPRFQFGNRALSASEG